MHRPTVRYGLTGARLIVGLLCMFALLDGDLSGGSRQQAFAQEIGRPNATSDITAVFTQTAHTMVDEFSLQQCYNGLCTTIVNMLLPSYNIENFLRRQGWTVSQCLVAAGDGIAPQHFNYAKTLAAKKEEQY